MTKGVKKRGHPPPCSSENTRRYTLYIAARAVRATATAAETVVRHQKGEQSSVSLSNLEIALAGHPPLIGPQLEGREGVQEIADFAPIVREEILSLQFSCAVWCTAKMKKKKRKKDRDRVRYQADATNNNPNCLRTGYRYLSLKQFCTRYTFSKS